MRTTQSILFLLIIVFLSNAPVQSQTECCPLVQFTYDNAGNRIKREVIIIPPVETDVLLKTNTDNPDEDNGENNNQEEKTEKTWLDKIGDVQIKLYPNPVNEQLIVEVENAGPEAVGTLQLYEISGKLLYTKANLSAKNQLNFSGRASGNYIMKITIDGEQKEWVVIKQ